MTAVLKSPVEERCTSTGLRGCPQLVDGILLYAEGNKPAAQQKFEQVVAQNSPDDVKRYAKTLVEVSSLPGAGQFAGPIVEIASVLTASADAGASVQVGAPVGAPAADAAGAAAPQAVATAQTTPSEPLPEPDVPKFATDNRDRTELLLYSINAASDPMRMITDSAAPAAALAGAPCMIGDVEAKCVRLRQGPLVVTDVVALQGCPDTLFVVSASDPPTGGVRWLIEARPDAITGARLFVRGSEWLYVAMRPKSKELSRDPRCVVTWSGFTPRLVPQQR